MLADYKVLSEIMYCIFYAAGHLALGAELGCCSVDRTIQIQCILQFFSS